LEFLALALTRAVLPSLLLQKYADSVYIVLGFADFVRGLLAFVACPLFGKISDAIGRKSCLFVTVLGTCAPVCSLAFFSWDKTVIDEEEQVQVIQSHPYAISVFVVLLSLSGIFSSTFTLVFAYISDTVKNQDERVSAYGLALATFGLSFTLGPMAGGYLAKADKQYVFLSSLILTILDLLYIYLVLPESRKLDNFKNGIETMSFMSLDYNNLSWNPWNTLRVVTSDKFLRQVGKIAFLYYTGLWALISTLSVYAVKRFHLSPERLGELMSALGLSTMVAEAVLVRIMVPILGEKRAMRVGLISFAIQCCILGFAYDVWHLFVCAAFSMLGNLVYPSLSSLVSGSVEPDAVGEALGAINGIKALTEGFGPLVFGSLMTISEKSALPGWPYIVAAVLVLLAYKEADELPDIEEDDYVHELERKHAHQSSERGIFMRTFVSHAANRSQDSEIEGLLSEVEESSVDEKDMDKEDTANHVPQLSGKFVSLALGRAPP
jgi:DHA1 family tetracycline resistance protein-like MFS transporter